MSLSTGITASVAAVTGTIRVTDTPSSETTVVGIEHVQLAALSIALVARGRSNAEIAAELYLSTATVKTHVTRILAKLDLRDRVRAVVLAYESGLVEPGGAG